jgi:hypothetical protein
MNRNIAGKVTAVFASRRFFYGVLAFFIFEALWTAFSAVYPMAFDEDFHFGIIKIYSHHWLPFLSGRPAGTSAYGAISRDPSYFYHYLMSFPYRLIELFTHDQTVQVIWLRLVNVALFAYELVLMRRVLLNAKVSAALTNVSVLLFVLIPIVPLLAAQINYDNLCILVIAWTCLLMERIFAVVQTRKIPVRDIGLLVILALLGCIVKYSMLPVFAACAIMIAAAVWHAFRHELRNIRKELLANFRTLGAFTVAGLTVLIVISFGLFSQRYLLNLAAYKTPIPKCDRVLSVDECMSYGPWARSYIDQQYKSESFKPSVTTYTPRWLYGMWYRLFFGVNGNVTQPAWARNESFEPLLLPGAAGILLFAASLALVVRQWRRLFWGNWCLSFFLVLGVLYVVALFADNFAGYALTGQPIAINGRYLLPILLPIIAVAARAWEMTLHKRDGLKVLIAVLVIILFLQGGGVLTFMVDGNYTWYWPDRRVQSANWYAHVLARKIVYDYQPAFIQSP